MQNICFFNSIKFWGGGEKLHLESALEFQKLDYNVLILSKLNAPLWQKAKQAQLDTSSISVGNLSFLNPFKILKLRRFFKRKQVDTLIISSSQDLKLGSLAAYLASVKRIVYLRALASPIKNSFLNRIIFRHILTHIIANSNETKKTILKHLGKYIRADTIQIIYQGLDPEKQSCSKTTKLERIAQKGRGIILGNAGRLTVQKGQDKLLKIAKLLADKDVDFTLFIAGTGELKSKLTSLIEEYQLSDRVILLGFVENMELFMNSIDIFLLSSAWEGFGFVLAEAMLKSKPVVAFDITSNPEVVEHNKTGFLVKYPDLEMFTEKIIQLIRSKPLRETMGQAGLDAVHRKFLLQDRVLELEACLKRTRNKK